MAAVIPPRFDWLLPEPMPDPPIFAGFGPPVATLLARRGFRDDAGLNRFLDAGRASLHDIKLMADAGRALDRVEAAVERGERIAIWGDYDADGMTSIVIWVLALRALGVEALRHVPSRLEEGYGLSALGLRRLADAGVTLVVTCDCGIANAVEVEFARSVGIEVVVTDHHLPPSVLPRAVAVVDPHRTDCAYPDPDLTGAGISYKLTAELLARRGLRVDGLAAIAAIGTVADMAPMTGESRAIVRLGLAEMGAAPRAGLRALLRHGADNPQAPTGHDLAFAIAPRINAAGRIAEAELAISLLLSDDEVAAEQLADELERVHERRRELTVAVVAEALALVEGDAGIGPLALRNDGWAAGLLGLIAGRLAETLARPVAVAALIGDEVRGSVRAPADFHVAAALELCAEHLTKRGGHAGAGGFSVLPEGWEAFVATFGALPRHEGDGSPGQLRVDLVLPARYLDWPLADQLLRLAPYGPGHVEPLLAVTGLRVAGARRVGEDGRHLAFRLLKGHETFEAIAFGMPPDRPLPTEGSLIDLVGTLERDAFGGVPRLRLRVLDYATTADSPLITRRLPRPELAAVS